MPLGTPGFDIEAQKKRQLHGQKVGGNAAIANTTGPNRMRFGSPGGITVPSYGTGGGGGGGGGAGGGPGGGRVGNVVNYQTQTPDYMTNLMSRLEDLWGTLGEQADEPLDFEGERAQIRKEQSQQRKEASDIAGARGGEWGSNLADRERGFAETRAGAEAGFTNREFDARQRALEALSASMGLGLGLTGQMSGHELGMLGHLRDVSRIQLDEAGLEDEMARWRAELDARYRQMDDDRWYNEQRLEAMV
jgi:hypothetical protein